MLDIMRYSHHTVILMNHITVKFAEVLGSMGWHYTCGEVL